MTKRWLGFSIVVGLVFILATLACDIKSSEEKQAEEQELRAKQAAQALEALSRFGSRFNAEVVNDLDKTVGMGAFSILVEKTLIREGGKPIVFWSMVKDVSKSAREYLVHFHRFDSIHYSLKCQEDHINQILENTSSAYSYTEFAVVAVIDSVKRIDLSVWADASVSEEGYSPSVAIGLESGDPFWATGRCLALKPRAALLPD